MNKKIKLLIVSLLLVSGVTLYSCKKEESKPTISKIEKISNLKASPGFAALAKKVAGLIGNFLNIKVDFRTGSWYYEEIYKDGQLISKREGCNPCDAICILHISSNAAPNNPDFILNGLLGVNDKGELLCCIDEIEDPASYQHLVNPEGYLDLTSDLVIDDKDVLSAFGLSEPFIIGKGHIPFQSIDGVTIINLGVH